jgi:hypothetical protein
MFFVRGEIDSYLYSRFHWFRFKSFSLVVAALQHGYATALVLEVP